MKNHENDKESSVMRTSKQTQDVSDEEAPFLRTADAEFASALSTAEIMVSTAQIAETSALDDSSLAAEPVPAAADETVRLDGAESPAIVEEEDEEENGHIEEEEEENSAEAEAADGADDLGFVDDDPLAPAYDLERGTLIDKQQSVLPWRSDVRTAKEFFSSELLYRFDILEDEERDKISGKYRIELKGYQGGVWTISVGNDIEVVNRKEDADLVLIMQQRDFLQMVNGRLNPQLAILGSKIRLHGDVKRAVWFQSLLYPSAD